MYALTTSLPLAVIALGLAALDLLVFSLCPRRAAVMTEDILPICVPAMQANNARGLQLCSMSPSLWEA
mgnify:FL=1